MGDSNAIIENLSVDCMVYGFEDNKLKILLFRHRDGVSKGQWALPGGFVEQFENVDKAADRILCDTTGIDDVFLDQFRLFGDVERYPFRRVVTMSYFALVRPEHHQIIPGLPAEEVKWFDVANIPQLIFDHNEIVGSALKFLKEKVKHEPIGVNLLPAHFTLDQLKTLYEVILETTLDEEVFRNNVLLMKPLKEVILAGDENSDGEKYFSFDMEVYHKFLAKGFSFDF